MLFFSCEKGVDVLKLFKGFTYKVFNCTKIF